MKFTHLLIEFPIVLLLMLGLFRLMGNKEFQQSTPLDFAFVVLLASITWDMTLTPDFNLWQTFLMMVILCIIIYAFDWFTTKSRKAEKLIVGEPMVLVRYGQINEPMLKKARISKAELKARLRLKGIFSLEEVEICYLEFNGEISVKVEGK